MKIEIGMHFHLNVNNQEIEITKVSPDYVQYCDTKNGIIHEVGRVTFERCDITEVKNDRPENT